MGIERRIQDRFQPKDSTFVAFRPDFTKLGRVVDISIGGLCFQYMDYGEPKLEGKTFGIDIFKSNNGYYLSDISCKLVHEAEVGEGMTFLKDMKNRRCGIQFKDLKQEQADMINEFLTKHTSDKV